MTKYYEETPSSKIHTLSTRWRIWQVAVHYHQPRIYYIIIFREPKQCLNEKLYVYTSSLKTIDVESKFPVESYISTSSSLSVEFTTVDV